MSCQDKINIDPISEDIQDNSILIQTLMPLFYTLGLSSLAASIFYIIVSFFKEQIEKKFFSSIQLENNDPMFAILQTYLSEVGLIKSKLSNLTANLEKNTNLKWWQSDQDSFDNFKPNIKYTPSSGNHKFYYKNRTIFVKHMVGNTITVGYERTPQKQESIQIWCFGKGKIEFLKEILDEAYGKAQKKDHGKTNIFALHEWFCGWDKAQTKEPRNFESVILDSNLAETVIDDLQNFLKSQEWYKSTGVPYKRGYLLHGPPGTGKTSFILAIAGKLNLNICTVNLSGNRLNDDSLNRLLESTPSRSIVLLEDVDAIFVDRDSVQKDKDKGEKVSFSGLLNALDGVRSQEGRILFMTTNHKEKLDPALMRPGRADIHLKLNYASANQVKRLFLKFFPEEEKLANEFSKQIPEFSISMAKLQGQFLKYKNNPRDVIDNIQELLEVEIENHSNMTVIDLLIRLGIPQYAYKFIEQKIVRIHDLAIVEEGDLEEKFGVKILANKKRIMGIINDEPEFMKSFQLMSHNNLRNYIKSLFQNDKVQEKQFLQIIEKIPENLVTKFQIKDIIDTFGNDVKIFEEKINILTKILLQFQINPELKQQFTKFQDYQKSSYEVDISQIIKDLGLEEYLNNFTEQNILNETEIFLNLEEGDMGEILKIENYGHKKKLVKKIEELKEKKEEFIKSKENFQLQKILEFNEQQLK